MRAKTTISDFRTINETKMKFRGIHDIVIPAGSPVLWISGGTGGYAVLPERVKLESNTRALFNHDATYYFIWVDAANVKDCT